MSRILENRQYAYDDLTIQPAPVSGIDSRQYAFPFYIDERTNNKVLPIFTAPMSSVINMKNIKEFADHGIIPIVPRSINWNIRHSLLLASEWRYWIAFGYEELCDLYNGKDELDKPSYILLDIANGHLQKVLEICKNLKGKYSDNLHLMAGNIANEDTLPYYEEAGIEYARVGIGSGSVCITSSNTGCHAPMGSLIHQCYIKKTENNLNIKIIADGGIRNYDDVLKALALGADYVMIGGLFGSFFESAAEVKFENFMSDYITDYDGKDSAITITGNTNYYYNTYTDLQKYYVESGLHGFRNIPMKLLNEDMKRDIIMDFKPRKVIYGMASKKAQSELFVKSGQTAEGIEKMVECKYTIKQWTDNMKAYMRSIMTYTNSRNLRDFIGKQTLIVNSPAEQAATNK